MTINKIILIVVVLTVAVVGVVFLVQKSDKENVELLEKNEVNKKLDKTGVIYKLSENGCRLGIRSADGLILDRDFYKVCPGGIITNINKQTCTFAKCIFSNDYNTDDWVLYKNEKYKFSIKYPKDWSVGVLESETGANKIEVLFSNEKCSGDKLQKCPADFSGYRILFYQTTPEQAKMDNSNVEYYKKGSSEIKELNLFSGERIFLYIASEFNEKNFKDTMNSTLPGAQAVLNKGGYSIYFMGDFRGNADTLEYFEASLKTMGFN